MDWLYRIFYTVFSLGILMVLLLPLVVVARFLLRNYRKKYTIWIWWLLFLRSICPVSLSSPICIVPAWNRKYHQLLSQLGLSIKDNSGIMRSWLAVFQNDITVAGTFKICSIIWAVGIMGILLAALYNTRKFKRNMQSAKVLGENIYETSKISVPIQIGFFHKNFYLPKGFQAKDMAWLLRHMESHSREGLKRILILLVMAVHWFNPIMWLYHYWWENDMEMAADDKTVQREKTSGKRDYAQGLMNFRKELGGTGSTGITGGIFFIGIKEENVEKRASRIMYQKGNSTSNKLSALLLLSVVTIFCFLLRPMQIAWAGGTWGNGNKNSEQEALFKERDTFVVAKMNTKSPEGLDRIIQLEMIDGTENTQGYQGEFILKMYDTMENEITSRKVANILTTGDKHLQYFAKGVTLCINDYNNDDVQELVLGQQIEKDISQKEEKDAYLTYSYSLINLADKSFDVLLQDIIVTDQKANMSESILFGKPEGIKDIFTVQNRDDKVYYVWDNIQETYKMREMTEEELAAHRENADSKENSGEVREHTLEDKDGKTVVLVSTKPDSTGSEAIQSVVLFPRGASKRFEDVQGYYCDLKWVEDAGEENRYAQLIYNGTKSQTFIIYDTKRKTVYYRHEDGTVLLGDVFAQYRETDITFEEEGVVIYGLGEKKEDILTINFAADADGDVTVKGSYTYDVLEKEASDLSYTRAMEEN